MTVLRIKLIEHARSKANSARKVQYLNRKVHLSPQVHRKLVLGIQPSRVYSDLINELAGHPALRTRTARTSDDLFVRNLFMENRRGWFEPLGLDGASLDLLLVQQENARRVSYGVSYPNAVDRIALSNGRPVGRILTAVVDAHFELIDLAVAATERRQGFGEKLVRMVQGEAATAGLPIKLLVDETNEPAKRLYARLGFVRTASNGLDATMQWHPPMSTSKELRVPALCR